MGSGNPKLLEALREEVAKNEKDVLDHSIAGWNSCSNDDLHTYTEKERKEILGELK